LTLYAFIATTLLPGTKLEIISNNATFIKLIEQTNIVEPYKMALLDKTDYPNTLRIIKALTLNIQTTLRLDKE
ncbi:13878_t:CDS:1, partial [Gigaspora rosea]